MTNAGKRNNKPREGCKNVELLQDHVKIAIKQLSSESLTPMPVGAYKRQARQRSSLELDNSVSTIFQGIDTENSKLTEEQITDTTQEIENKSGKKEKVKSQRPRTQF